MSYKDFIQTMDKEGNLVHGSFLNNLEGILDFGICPPSLLPEKNKPESFFGGRNKAAARCGTNMNYISTMVLKDVNGFSFERQYFWSPFFHYFIVAEHNDWGQINGNPLEARRKGEPYCYYSTELTLYNQKISPDEFIGFVTYNDEMIKRLSKNNPYRLFDKSDGKLMTSNEINNFIMENLKKRGMSKHIYSIDGVKIL
ncbi:MAG: hypothetical protein ACP5N3_04040 [Candidatus Nanoarchaeia archaeon]